MILGDNIFYGNGLGNMLKASVKRSEKGRATVFGFYVNDPERFGVVEFDENNKALSIDEKSGAPKSNYAVTGLYFYPAGVSEMAKEVKPSARGELEITTLNQIYLEKALLDCDVMGRGFSWLDTGTMDSLMQPLDLFKQFRICRALLSQHQKKLHIDIKGLLKNNCWWQQRNASFEDGC